MSAKSEVRRIVRFCLAGGICLLIYYGVLYSFTEWLHFLYLVSAVFASVLSMSVNFFVQKFWTFGSREVDRLHRQAGRYAAMVVGLFVLNLAGLFVLVEYVHLWYLLAQAVMTIIASAVSYLISRRIFST